MKRLNLILLPALLICTATLQASQVPPKGMTPAEGSREMHHPLLAKVFPGVLFMEEPYYTFSGIEYKVVALYEGEHWGMTDGFNLLFAKMIDHSTATDAEIVEAFARLHFWTRDQQLEITSHETKPIEIITKEGSHWPFHHRIRFSMHRGNKIYPAGEILVRLESKQIILAYVIDPDGKSGYMETPMRINFTDDFGLELVGMMPQTFPNEQDPQNHYYIPTSINWIPQTAIL